jgi:lipopolysaccharide export system permease protein
MVIWFSSGLPLTAWIKPVLAFACPIVVLIAVLSLLLSPWAMERSDDYRRQMNKRDDLARVAPGVFRESADAERVFFVEAVAGDQAAVRNVFISSVRDGQLGVMVSQRGFWKTNPLEERFVVLLSGRRYQGTPGTPEFQVMNFERYAMRVQSTETRPEATPVKAMSTLQLLSDRTNPNLAEFLWRIGLPLSALTLALLAIPLSFVNPRASRSINLIFALLTYMVYSNLVSIAQAWVSQGKLSFYTGWWIVHAGMAVLLAVMLWRRMQVGSPLRR